VSKPARGLFVPTGAEDRTGAETIVAESEFYAPIADFLVEEAEDLTAAIPLGGRCAGNGKWGTPDVLGVYRPTAGDVLTWSPELLSVEVKTTTRDVVAAFGQAIAYQIFSTKSYVAVPEAISPSDRHELTTRCQLHGLGLILLGATPDAEHVVAVRARRCQPDTEATRRFIERLRRDPERFRALFG
jgi:hypothetical protein